MPEHSTSLIYFAAGCSPVLRRNVQKALNRGEAHHQLRRAIAYAHGGRFRVRSQHEQELLSMVSHSIKIVH